MFQDLKITRGWVEKKESPEEAVSDRKAAVPLCVTALYINGRRWEAVTYLSVLL